jgi:hypothetical protein
MSRKTYGTDFLYTQHAVGKPDVTSRNLFE